MSRTESKGSPSSFKPGSSQLVFFQIILMNMKNKLDVDWDVVAEKAGYKSGKTARDRFGNIMRDVSTARGIGPSRTAQSSPPEDKPKLETTAGWKSVSSKVPDESTNLNPDGGKTAFRSKVTKNKPTPSRNRLFEMGRPSRKPKPDMGHKLGEHDSDGELSAK